MTVVNGRRGPGSHGLPEPARAGRLRLLAAMDDSPGDRDVLLSGLQQATAGLGGLGGMAHLHTGSQDRPLRLVASVGLPRAFTEAWRDILADGPAAPARAVRGGGPVWLPAVVTPPQRFRREPPAVDPGLLPAGTGLAAAPLPGPDGTLGSLSVLTAPYHEPEPEEQEFLAEVARWVAGRLRLAAPDRGPGTGPEDPASALVAGPDAGRRERQTLHSAAVEVWEWDLRTGELTVNEPFRELFGHLAPEALAGRIDSWVDAIHPEDLPWVLAEVDTGIRTRGKYEVEHRVRRADGTYGWVRVRGRVIREGGEPVRVIGTLWDTTETHAALESVGRALRHMDDGFLALDAQGRVGFVNLAAERLLGSPHDLAGRPLWEVPALRDVPGLAERCRRAAATGETTGFDMPWPDGDRWYHLRVVPVPDGLTLYVTDITERRRREAADRAAAERTALVGQVTRALAEAVTAQDVVAAVADSILPFLGAGGIVVATIEHGRMNVIGAVGYDSGYLQRLHGSPVALDSPVGEALRTRTPRFFRSTAELIGDYPEALPIDATKSARMFLPLVASGRAVGSAIVSFDGPRELSEDERTLLTALSGLIAQALERAALYDAATSRAHQLQRALLPRVLPALPAVTAAARYLPAARGTEVGRDWYDVIPLSADRVALVIGDVMGHGMSEAATMGRLRTAVRTLSDLELSP
ncbi:PAS domain-containing protein, partial [Streptomyces sp. B1866]|uniref:SpoIIE family protein phosphatase n=1 Tax=Streptomyces sp. B1866 TaxID=3075431 RepID=UPI0028902D8E